MLGIFHRLRHNVIRAGIKMISQSYSRISFEDICAKLHLDNKEDAEYVVAKVLINFWICEDSLTKFSH
jgi:hypothetical protein